MSHKYYCQFSSDVLWDTGNSIRKPSPKNLYPIFARISENVDDTWKNVFINCSNGKFPKGLMVKNNVLHNKKKLKINMIEIKDVSDDDLPDYTNEMVNFFTQSTGLRSKNDKINDNAKLLNKLKETKTLLDFEWKDLKKRDKDILLNEYFVHLGFYLKLSHTQRNILISYMSMTSVASEYHKMDVSYGGGIIRSIPPVNIETYKIGKTGETQIPHVSCKYFDVLDKKIMGDTYASRVIGGISIMHNNVKNSIRIWNEKSGKEILSTDRSDILKYDKRFKDHPDSVSLTFINGDIKHVIILRIANKKPKTQKVLAPQACVIDKTMTLSNYLDKILTTSAAKTNTTSTWIIN